MAVFYTHIGGCCVSNAKYCEEIFDIYTQQNTTVNGRQRPLFIVSQALLSDEALVQGYDLTLPPHPDIKGQYST